MKNSQRIQKLFFVALFTMSLSISVVWSITNSYIMFAPPAEGTWEIYGSEVINQDTIINGTVDIKYLADLTIANCTVSFTANSSFSPNIINDGTLTIINSTILLTDFDYQIDLECKPASTLIITDSYIFNMKIWGRAASSTVSLQSTLFSNCSEILFETLADLYVYDCTFEDSHAGLTLDSLASFNLDFNVFDNNDYGLEIIDCSSGVIENNNFTSNLEIGLLVTRLPAGLTYLDIINNRFSSSPIGTELQKCGLELTDNVFTNLDTALILDDCDHSAITDNTFENLSEEGIVSSGSDDLLISDNEFTDILGIGVELSDTWDPIISFNDFTDVEVGINMIRVREGLLEENVLFNVLEGIGVISSRGIEIIGNSIENTITGIYLEQTKDLVVTANGAINATYGISLWSCNTAIAASNGVLDSVYGFSIWFSDDIRLAGNEVNTSDIGIVARSTSNLRITDGNYRVLTQGIQIIGSYQPYIAGNSFTNITTTALIFKDSNSFIVFHNNFDNIGTYGEIINCVGVFEYWVDNVTLEGNYYEGEPAGVPVLIDNGIYDNHPLSSVYNVKPSIEFVTRETEDPTDQDDVIIYSQIFIPTGTDVTVSIQYVVNMNTTWESVDISLSEEPVGSIGAISAFYGTIPAFPYDYSIVYRLRVEYDSVELISENETYVVLTSDVTPVIIHEPEIRVETIIEDVVETVSTSDYYENIEFFIFVEIENRTDLDILSGKRRVNLTWSEMDPATNLTAGYTDLMSYNSTTDEYYYDLGKGYVKGTIIDYFISVVDVNGTIYRTVFNYTIEITIETEESGFDTITLLSIGGTLLIIQTIVVIRRRKRRNKEE